MSAHCQTCAFFNAGDSECRRYAPQPAQGEKKASWPTVSATDWCGEYQADAEKAKKAS